MEKWFAGIVRNMFRLMHNVETNNFDGRRFAGGNPNAFHADYHAGFFLFLDSHREQFAAARDLFADEESRALFDLLVLFRLLGHMHVRLPFNSGHALTYESVTSQWKVDDNAGPEGTPIFAIPTDDQPLVIGGGHDGIATNFVFRQYRFDRGGVRIAPAEGDRAVDAGGCFGDTAISFAHEVGRSGLVYTFDPLPKHCSIMRENFAMNPALQSRIQLFPLGISDRDHAGTGEQPDTFNPAARTWEDESLPTRTIDSLVDEGLIERIDFLKMDVEGSELAALKGGERALRRWKPKLALSLYHRHEDFFAIPMWLNALDIGYRFYLDHYSVHQEETVLYAA